MLAVLYYCYTSKVKQWTKWLVHWSYFRRFHCATIYRIALNFRGAQFSRFREFGDAAKFMHHENILNLLLAATSSSGWALAGLLSKETPTSSIYTANSDV